MENNVAAAAVAAVVATSITLIVTEIRKAKDAKAQTADVNAAYDQGLMKGWYDGRESLFQQFRDNVKPQEFIPNN